VGEPHLCSFDYQVNFIFLMKAVCDPQKVKVCVLKLKSGVPELPLQSDYSMNGRKHCAFPSMTEQSFSNVLLYEGLCSD